MASFSKAFAYLMQNEGGYVDNPNDTGGKTKFGITEGIYSFYLDRRASEDDMMSITKDIAQAVYKKFFWDPLKLDEVVSDGVATAIFDQVVNRGQSSVSRDVQRLIGVKTDGIVGHLTIMAINEQDPKEFIINFSRVTAFAYKSIAANNPSKQEFLTGWINRANRLLTLA
jgi:lysozyme family protein